jgi:phosphatidylserine/phosphatidylglycerophosphate/cardiolipin synthase-like enzyme
MRVQEASGGLTALAVAGNHVVLLGWDLSDQIIRAQPVLGFAISRSRGSDGEMTWLKGTKTFESVTPDPEPGVQVSSFKHPFQTFQWADYTVTPGETYTYRIVAMQGLPGKTKPYAEVKLQVKTESIDLGRHAVFFNRGAVASQEYARRFKNQPPSDVGQAAYDWLSRGLVEGLIAFIERTKAGDGLFGAFFEFQNHQVFEALSAASHRGVQVAIRYDSDSAAEANEKALEGAGIDDLVKPREHSGGFAHNKFLVFCRGGAALEVWTGSTNLTENGIYGHSNNAHLVRDPEVAGEYLNYWQILDRDQTRKPSSEAVDALTAAPPVPWDRETSTVFSPRKTLDALDWYAGLARDAQRGLFGTFAFGMNERFVRAYEQPGSVLRFALMEKKGNGKLYKQQAADIDRLRELPNVVVSIGHRVAINAFDRWLAEIDRIVDEAHVLYVHTKYMLIDPLGPDPIVIVGSANFSAASTTDNDENMLVMRGNPAVADIYLGEFMRLFSHYAFRESLTFEQMKSDVAAERTKHLIEDASWIRQGTGYFDAGQDRALRRVYFSGQ